MNMKSWIPLGVALLLGLVAAIVAFTMKSDPPATAAVSEKTHVVMALEDIAPGKMISSEILEVREVSLAKAPAGSFKTISEVAGRISGASIERHQFVTDAMLAPKGATRGLAALIPQGMRAITLEVNEFSGMTGLLKPGARVDVISLLRDPIRDEMLAKTVAQNLKVTAIGGSTGEVERAPGDPLPRSVTLLVTPAEAQALQLSTTNGRPWLVLRNDRDDEPAEIAATTLSDLRGAVSSFDPFAIEWAIRHEPTTKPAEPAAVAKESKPVETFPVIQPRKHRTVKLIRGGAETNVVFEMVARPEAQYSGAPYEIE